MNRLRQAMHPDRYEPVSSFLAGLTPLLLAVAFVVLLVYLAKLAPTIT
jgi:hypothetical protein